VTGHLPAARGRRETGARTGAPHSRPGEERAVEDHVKQSGMTYTILAPPPSASTPQTRRPGSTDRERIPSAGSVWATWPNSSSSPSITPRHGTRFSN